MTARRYSKDRVVAVMLSDRCSKCGSRMLYHDFDPTHYHNGITCLMCGTEQVLKTGAKSLIDPNAPRAKGTLGGHWGWRNN
jgi:hypothetical protein